MRKVYNLGVGLVIITAKSAARKTTEMLQKNR